MEREGVRTRPMARPVVGRGSPPSVPASPGTRQPGLAPAVAPPVTLRPALQDGPARHRGTYRVATAGAVRPLKTTETPPDVYLIFF